MVPQSNDAHVLNQKRPNNMLINTVHDFVFIVPNMSPMGRTTRNNEIFIFINEKLRSPAKKHAMPSENDSSHFLGDQDFQESLKRCVVFCA